MNDELSIEEAIMIREFLLGQINSQFELWLTITFAVIIASYIAGHRLSRSLRILVASLYLSVSVLLLAVLAGAVDFARELGEIDLLDSPDFNAYLIAFLRPSVWILGTITTVVFIFWGSRNEQRPSSADPDDA